LSARSGSRARVSGQCPRFGLPELHCSRRKRPTPDHRALWVGRR